MARIGVTAADKQIVALILVGRLFDAFEQNMIGIVSAAIGRLLSSLGMVLGRLAGG